MKSRMPRRFIRTTLLLVIILIGALAWHACGGGPTSTPEPVPTEEPPPQLDSILGTHDLGVGTNRVSFLLLTDEGLVTTNEASVSSRYVGDDSQPDAVETATPSFHLWPFGTRGNYVVNLSFDRPGAWELDVSVEDSDGSTLTGNILLEVKGVTTTPWIGDEPPLVDTKTLGDVSTLTQLTGWSTPDPDLYRKSLPDALEEEIPLVLVVSSPAFCTTPTCGPQAETVRDLKNKYSDQANFIHVDVYDNPSQIATDIDMGIYSPIVEAWGLSELEGYLNESWVFIIDQSGRIAARYEAYASLDELEQGLLEVL